MPFMYHPLPHLSFRNMLLSCHCSFLQTYLQQFTSSIVSRNFHCFRSTLSTESTSNAQEYPFGYFCAAGWGHPKPRKIACAIFEHALRRGFGLRRKPSFFLILSLCPPWKTDIFRLFPLHDFTADCLPVPFLFACKSMCPSP